MKKTGRISKKEEAFIAASYKDLNYYEIAEELNRDPTSIQEFIKRKYRVGITKEENAAFNLQQRVYWAELQQQFTEDELRLFEYYWARIVSQFGDDVIPTEEMQIVDLVKSEILMNRCLKVNKGNIEQINSLDTLLNLERANDSDQQDKDNIFNLERQLASLKASQESLNRDYRDLQDKKNKMLKDMRATREQRIKRIEDSKESFSGWMVALMNNPDKAKKYGIEMEKMRLAMEKEKGRLSQYHKYMDGTVDKPFLTAETINDL